MSSSKNQHKKTSNINHLISNLIDKSSNYKNNFNKRLILTKVFSEFEDKAYKEFHNYIHDSNFRYKGMKSGNDLDSVISRSINKSKYANNRILTDNFYISYNIDKERNHMRHLGNSKETKEIKSLINSVLNGTNSLSDKEQLYRKNLNEEYEKEKTNRYSIKDIISPRIKQLKVILPNSNFDQEIRLKRNKEIIGREIKKDENDFNNEVSKYKETLSTLGNDLINDDEEAKRNLKQMHLFNPYKMLTYKKLVREKKNEVKNDDKLKRGVDYKKIIKFSKAALATGKPPQTDEEIKASIVQLPLKNLDYRNTKDIVLTEAMIANELEHRIAQKEHMMDKCLKIGELPPIDEYQKIIMERIKKEKVLRKQELEKNCVLMSNVMTTQQKTKKEFEKNCSKWKIEEALLMELNLE